MTNIIRLFFIFDIIDAMKRLIKILISILCILPLIGCEKTVDEDALKEYPESKAYTKSDVLDTKFSQNNILSDGSVALVDYSQSNLGYLGIQLINDPGVKVKLLLEKDGKKYTFDIDSTKMVAVPLSMGNGTYSLKVAQNIEGTSYAVIAAMDIPVSIDDDLLPYLYPNQVVDYHKKSKVVDISMEIVNGDTNDLERIYHIFRYVLENLDYDDEKAEAVKNTYVLPNLDETISCKKGICFDYAALMAALCRVQHIPCRVIVGATDIEYHAWCEIYLENEGWINPKLYFDASTWSLVDPTFADSSKDYEGRYEEDYHY